MSLEAIAQVLEEAGAGRRGSTIFVGAHPTDGTRGILLREPAPAPVDPTIGGPGKLRRLSFQAVVRDTTYPGGKALAEQAMVALTLRQKRVEGIAWIYECNPRHEPAHLGRETSGLYLFVVNFDATWRAL